jgi:hypothetical protein
MTTTDTPRTDACPYCGYAWRKSWGMWYCGTFEQTKGLFRTELCYEREARQKAEAELQRIYAGMQGSCYCCEPVGVMNQKLEAEVDRLKNALESL